MIRLASGLELITMSIEVMLYLIHSVYWKLDNGPIGSFLSVFFLMGALFALSNIPYSILGMGMCQWGGDLEDYASLFQRTILILTPASMIILYIRVRQC